MYAVQDLATAVRDHDDCLSGGISQVSVDAVVDIRKSSKRARRVQEFLQHKS
jgi:hypothetical protein